jgi:CBS domain-containing protein
MDKIIDIRPYIIDTPYLAQSTDRLQKILNIFRHMHLRALPVTNPGTGELEGIITRQDIFAYMGL